MTTPSPVSDRDPAAEYRRRAEGHRRVADGASSSATRLSAWRLVVFLAGVALAVAAASDVFSWHLLWPAAAVFVVLVVLHQRAVRRAWDAGRLLSLYERGVARVEDRWVGTGDTGDDLRPEAHVYADDLDLFGRGSLFELLCTARTGAGRERLAAWLLAGATVGEVRGRQAAVDELRTSLDLRQRMAVLGGESSSALDRSAATAWGEAEPRLVSRVVPWVARSLGIATTVLAVGWGVFGWPFLPLAVALLLQFVWTVPYWGRVSAVLEDADRPSQDLALAGGLLRVVEAQAFRSPWLRGLVSDLEVDGSPPSRRIRRLTTLMDFVDARRNQIFLPISWLLCLGTQLAFAIERWRAANGRDLVRWVDALGRFEAVTAISGYAYEHPADPFPVLAEEATTFAGRALGHPLLPAGAFVTNDAALARPAADGSPQAMLVSGSNMSGKSTLLRTVGINTVLGLAGAPVRAEALTLSPLAVGASIRIHDNLQAGESHFYAEIARLRRIVDLTTGEQAALFLIDEMLHGTNSHDRRIGAAAVIRSLLEAGALGLVTTHDLALADIADSDGRMVNVHFEDRLEDGRIRFDYRLHPGVVTHSNAIALMRSVGLDVTDP